MTSPRYNPNTPLITTTFADWQINFKKNFQALAIAFSQNHVGLDQPSNAGNHTYVELQNRTSSPNVGSNQFGIYCKKGVPNQPQVFMSFPGNSEFQYSSFQIYPLPVIDLQQPYFSFLPGGVMVAFGFVAANGLTSYNIQISPPLFKDLKTVNFTSVNGTQNSFLFTVIPSHEADFSVIRVTAGSIGSTNTPLTDFYYMIAGNI